ncbi:hypothetical protein CPB84DRAFT_1786565 [Gymnopilus junonius]|uniref:Uncharacterized protein n=1 Tax=Gymnopilus junonius TaxID=109634 RepID=A0A9P5NIA2_GYMJU|nr:hypothetical protein CPB84DRAFT_1786565 [Gymnopilus junonius]
MAIATLVEFAEGKLIDHEHLLEHPLQGCIPAIPHTRRVNSMEILSDAVANNKKEIHRHQVELRSTEYQESHSSLNETRPNFVRSSLKQRVHGRKTDYRQCKLHATDSPRNEQGGKPNANERFPIRELEEAINHGSEKEERKKQNLHDHQPWRRQYMNVKPESMQSYS